MADEITIIQPGDIIKDSRQIINDNFDVLNRGLSALSAISLSAVGASGYSGYQGRSGYSGYSGISGYQGNQGTSGFSGYQGAQGPGVGTSGYSGYQGAQGTTGLSGYSGTYVITQNYQTANYTITAADAGKHISITAGGVNIVTGVFAVGDAVSIFNNSTSSQTISSGSGVTMYLAGSSSTGNRTLAQRGLASVLCVSSTNVFVIVGQGLT